MEDKRFQLLMIDDDPHFERVVRLMLAGARVQEFSLDYASSLTTGLARLELGNIDLVLLDLSFPDTRELDSFIQVHAHYPEVPIVVLTSFDDRDWAVKAVGAGAQDYLVKGKSDQENLVRSVRLSIERHRLWAALRNLSFIDDLTGLYNRRGFQTLAEQHFKLASRTHRESLLVFADLDGLKVINDRYGHPEGDRALEETANILRETFRKTDIIARYGGDEFVILALEAREESSQTITERLAENLHAFNAHNLLPFLLDISIGIARFDGIVENHTLEDLIVEADARLYEVKKSKKASRE